MAKFRSESPPKRATSIAETMADNPYLARRAVQTDISFEGPTMSQIGDILLPFCQSESGRPCDANGPVLRNSLSRFLKVASVDAAEIVQAESSGKQRLVEKGALNSICVLLN